MNANQGTVAEPSVAAETALEENAGTVTSAQTSVPAICQLTAQNSIPASLADNSLQSSYTDSGNNTTASRHDLQATVIKANLHSLMSIVLQSTEMQNINTSLSHHVRRAPRLLANTPVIVDFSRIDIDPGFNFKNLFRLIRQRGMLPVAVRGINEALVPLLQAAGVPILDYTTSNPTPGSASAQTPVTAEPIRRPAAQSPVTSGCTLFVEKPVRAGQQVFAKEGDLVVLSQSNATAELIAGGNIHVYGCLRGKALAGVNGDKSCRIFCTQLEAELVSIAGHYKILEDVPPALQKKPVQIRLADDNRLLIEPLAG